MKWTHLYSRRKGRGWPLWISLIALIRQRGFGELLGKAYKLWKRQSWSGVYYRLAALGYSYRRWVQLFDVVNNDDRQLIRRHISTLKNTPRVSVLLIISDPAEHWLRGAIESVQTQLYSCWELCVASATPLKPNIQAVLDEYIRLDARMRKACCGEAEIFAAFNGALAVVSGEFVVLLGCQDKLSEHALYMVAVAVNEKPQVDMIYSDEDRIDNRGRRFDPFFKPSWDPDLFVAQNVAGNLNAYRTSVVRDVGGFRAGLGSWDLALRVSERIPLERIHHIPHVLYHRRATTGAPEMEGAGEEVHRTTVSDCLARSGRHAKAMQLGSGCFRIMNQLPTPEPLVSIIVPTHNGLNLLSRCIDTLIEKSSYKNYEIIIIDNRSDDDATLEYLDSLAAEGKAQILKYNFPFNYSAINNFAAREAKGEFLCLMNNDIEVISEGWLEEMVSQAARPDIGAVGAMLYYPDNTIQHAGVLVGMGGVAGHLYTGALRGVEGYKYRACLVQALSAVTAACLMIRAAVYREVGGLDEKNLPVAFNDVDFCLRVKACGYRNLWTPFAEFYHHESASRGVDDHGEKLQRVQREIAFMQSRWASELGSDPSHNPNLTLDLAYPLPSFPPRIEKPWRSMAALNS